MKKTIKKITRLEKIQYYIKKYNIPYEYISVNKSMVTKAIFIGLVIALLPLPMQMLIILFLMKFFTFNVPLALLLCWITNPVTIPFIYYYEYIIGSYILQSEIAEIEMTIEWFNTNFSDIFIPLYLGSFVVALSVASLSYFFVNYIWIYNVYKNKKKHYTKRKEDPSQK